MGNYLPGERHQGCFAEIEKLLFTYVDHDRKAEIDWSDPAKRNAQLKVLVTDSEAALELALQQIEDPEIRSLGWMINKILGMVSIPWKVAAKLEKEQLPTVLSVCMIPKCVMDAKVPPKSSIATKFPPASIKQVS